MNACKDMLYAFLAIVFALAVGFTIDIASQTDIFAKQSQGVGISHVDQPLFSTAQNESKEEGFQCRKS